MISKKLALEVLNAALSTGGDFAEIFLEETYSGNYTVENGKTQPPATSLTYGAGIRILKGLQSVYGHTSDLTKKGLLKLATSLSAGFEGNRALTVEKLKTVRVRKNHEIEKSLEFVEVKDIIEKLKTANKVIKDYSPSIVRAVTILVTEVRNITIFNSEGNAFSDRQERLRVVFQAIAMAPGAFEYSYTGPGAHRGFEYVEGLDLEKIAREVADVAVKKLTAVECPSGKMPVVIGNGFGGVIFHEACGHPLEASSVSKGLSPFAGKIGKQVAHPAVTAVDDGTIVNAWGSNNIDDEGMKTKKNVLIKNGILQNYLIDRFNGRRMNEQSNGTGRRQNYTFEPTSRMSNTYIAAGKYTPEEIIGSVKLGLYAKSLGGGSVDPSTGDFNFACEEAYIIRDGKIAELVKGASLIGNGAEILMKIDMVANDLLRAQGNCGAESGTIPVDVGQPTIRVSEIVVGGRGGKLQ
ncbi:MAG: protease TldD [Tenericutes bacterium ADurb.Bin239]|nr:MAG: protease TldD [Tenericutes bacterium ADurb.Bin239]